MALNEANLGVHQEAGTRHQWIQKDPKTEAEATDLARNDGSEDGGDREVENSGDA